MIGKPNEEELEAILETLPLEFSVLNKDDVVLAWNKHETRIFKRPEAVLGRNVRKCHPPKSVDKVEKIISEMKEGRRDVAEFWIDLPISESGAKRKILIRYFALRNKNNKYLGCLEVSMDITDIQKIKGEKRLLD
jgi:PAS domain S-box-containing protein